MWGRNWKKMHNIFVIYIYFISVFQIWLNVYLLTSYMTRFGLWIFMSKITHDFWLWIFNEGGIKIISLSNIRPIIIYFHSSQCRLIPYLHQRPIFFKANSSIVAILELIRGAQYLIEVIRSSGEEMWRVDAYQIPYYSRGTEEAKQTHLRFADCGLTIQWAKDEQWSTNYYPEN